MNGGVLIMKKYLKEILILLIQLFMFMYFHYLQDQQTLWE